MSASKPSALNPSLEKFARYFGLIPSLLLAWGLYLTDPPSRFNDDQARFIAAQFSPPLKTSLPTQMAIRQQAFREVSAFMKMSVVCESGRKFWDYTSCHWWEVLSESVANSDRTVLWRPEKTKEEMGDLYRRYNELKQEVLGNPKSTPPTRAAWKEREEALVEERHEYLRLIGLNAANAKSHMNKYLVLFHGLAAAAIVGLLLLRKWIGMAFVLPALAAFKSGRDLLALLHKKI